MAKRTQIHLLEVQREAAGKADSFESFESLVIQGLMRSWKEAGAYSGNIEDRTDCPQSIPDEGTGRI